MWSMFLSESLIPPLGDFPEWLVMWSMFLSESLIPPHGDLISTAVGYVVHVSVKIIDTSTG